MSPSDQARLRAILASLDEHGLVALANKGLLRRALKDLEGSSLSWEETETALLVRGADFVVTMPADGPTRATDDTRATGITRQILMATIYLRDHWASATSPPENPACESAHPASTSLPLAAPDALEPAASLSPTEPPTSTQPSNSATADTPRSPPGGRVRTRTAATTGRGEAARGEAAALAITGETLLRALLAVTDDELRKWSGKTLLAEGVALVSTITDDSDRTRIEVDTALVMRLLPLDIEVRWLPLDWGASSAKLLDQALCTAPKSQHKRWVTLAVLLLKRSHGEAVVVPGSTTAVVETGAPRSPTEVLVAAKTAIEQLVVTGLAHPSPRMVERLLTLSVAATGVHLPRLARLFRALADDVLAILERHVRADTSSLFSRLAVANALVRASLNAGEPLPLALAGRHRTEYEPVGELSLSGVAVSRWSTASGYRGLTTFFWEAKSKSFVSASYSRPREQLADGDLDRVYYAERIWSGAGPVSELSRQQFALRGARRNPEGRLSASSKSEVIGLCPGDPLAIDFGDRAVRDWKRLAEWARRVGPLGLAERSPLERLFVLFPAQWGPLVFDELRQQLVWTVFDEQHSPLALTLRWGEANERAIEFLEAIRPERDALRGVVVRLMFEEGVRVEPLSLLSAGTPRGDRLLCPGFDRARIESKQSTLLERLREKYQTNRIATVLRSDEEADEDTLDARHIALPGRLEARLSATEAYLLTIAESGQGRMHTAAREQAGQLAAGLQRVGLGELSQAVAKLSPTRPSADASAVAVPARDETARAETASAASASASEKSASILPAEHEPPPTPFRTASDLLWSQYLCGLHRQSFALRADWGSES